MKIVRFEIDQTRPDRWIDDPDSRPTVGIEGRIVLNRFEAWLLVAFLWVYDEVTYRLGRLLCRMLGWHNVTCRGRSDHDGTEALRWPRR